MLKITFMGAGSTVFVRNIIGDCLLTDCLKNSEFALYDIDEARLNESKIIVEAMNNYLGNPATVKTYLGVENRKAALKNASFVINAIQVGGYEPCTVIDFEIPKKYGLRQTIGDTLGIGGIMRALRTIPVVEDFCNDMNEVCPDAMFLNYVNPMAMITGYIQRFSFPNTVGLCHSVQTCAHSILKGVGMEEYAAERKELIAGINHQAWLLKIEDKFGNDLYPEIRKRVHRRLVDDTKFDDQVRNIYVERFGYYCTESSEHNAEYNPYFIKSKYPELIEKHNIPLDEYPRRCVNQIKSWKEEFEQLKISGIKEFSRSNEYASRIMEAVVTNTPYKIGGNVLNTNHLITNFPEEACVEVPCLVDGIGIHPTTVGTLPTACAALNMTNINCQLMTVEAARSHRMNDVYLAAMLDPHTGGELDIDTIIKMCDELIDAHGDFLPKFI
ncbi:MAG: alpha-glucosidase/alpha-galactosidase [Oscillospiraceae bacterium]|nr:alpha-glucosidase/alpha-galactosidase [Oscillospiraceae bacterium]